MVNAGTTNKHGSFGFQASASHWDQWNNHLQPLAELSFEAEDELNSMKKKKHM